jgi:hypothetical protein
VTTALLIVHGLLAGQAGQLEAPLPEPGRFVELRYRRLAGIR